MGIVWKIEGMMCGHCEAAVKKALEALEQVDTAEVSHEAGTAVVTLNSEISNEVLASYILNRFSLNAFVTTQKLDRLIAAAPNIGFNFQPKIGIQIPAASGIPIAL